MILFKTHKIHEIFVFHDAYIISSSYIKTSLIIFILQCTAWSWACVTRHMLEMLRGDMRVTWRRIYIWYSSEQDHRPTNAQSTCH